MPAKITCDYFRNMRTHEYQLQIVWTGNNGTGTSDYTQYRRDHEISAKGKITLYGSADPAFRGDPGKYNPEELFLSSISTCHMLWFLHLCSDAGIVVMSYEDNPIGYMTEGGTEAGRFIKVELHPVISITDQARLQEAHQLHFAASEKCFIRNSCNFPIECEL